MNSPSTQLIAAKIMALLEEKGRPLNLQEIFFYLDAPSDHIYLSLGRLMRENFISWETTKEEQWIRLAKETAPLIGGGQ